MRYCPNHWQPRSARESRWATSLFTATRSADGAGTTSCSASPGGIVPIGDAVASFNPTYGQGMTMTALQAGHLRRLLAAGTRHLAYDLARATAKSTYPVWTMNAIGDLTLHGTEGPAPWWYRPVGALFDQFLGAAENDRVLAEWFLRRFSLLDSLYMVPPASIVGRAIRHNMSLWWAQKRASAPVPGPDPVLGR